MKPDSPASTPACGSVARTGRHAARHRRQVVEGDQRSAGSRPEVVESLSKQGMDILGGTPEELGKTIASETEKWAKVVKAFRSAEEQLKSNQSTMPKRVKRLFEGSIRALKCKRTGNDE